nr:restriction endonuclease subunit S [Bacillota bacterium]
MEYGTPIITVEHLGDNRINHNNLPCVTAEDKERLSRYTLITGDIVFSRVGSVDRRALVHPEENGWLFSGRCLRVRPDRNKIDPGFLSWFFGLPTFQEHIRQIAVGATMPSLNTKILGDVTIYYPPSLKEQQAIACILGALDDKIELNRRMSETLEQMARAIFKSWFVDFDPVRAKSEGRQPPGLKPEIAALFPDAFEDSELGVIPRGWRVVALPEVIDVNPARTLRKGDIAPYLNMANMPTRGHSPDAVIKRAFGSGMRFVNGDTLVARITPCLENGKTAYVDFLRNEQVGWGSTEYIVLRPKPPLPAEFAYCLARGNEFREFAIQSMTGSSGRQRVPAESLAHFRFVAAPKPITELFGRLVIPLFARTSAAARESRILTAIRDTLLPKLLSGELRILDFEKLRGNMT